jgi:biopolymer transport protein ExbD
MKVQSEEKFESEADMTPIIDCCFNLLIFFVCNIRFKQLEGRLDAFLPKDVGVETTSSVLTENIEVRLKRVEGRTDVFLQRKRVETIASMDKSHEVKLETLFSTAKKLRELMPKTKTTIDPDSSVPHGHVLAVLNELLRADLTDISFAMSAAPR